VSEVASLPHPLLALGELNLNPDFPCKTATSWSRAEGIPTPDLRRAKAAPYSAGPFWRVQNSCKQQYFLDNIFLRYSGDLLGLLHTL
jgi:hypothetical protein